MGLESSSSPGGKRSRDHEDEAYLDNFLSHKRYLSEIMAFSLNGLTVGDSLSENLMESPARSESMSYPSFRDELYSPMSEDSEESQYCDTPLIMNTVQPDSVPTSPVSPHRYQRPPSGFSSTTLISYPSLGYILTAVACSLPRQRGSDSEGRFPSSPSDVFHSADLRRAALLRSVQMRAQPPPDSPALELPIGRGQEPMQSVDVEEQPCSCLKSLVDEGEYQNPQVPNLFIKECSSMGISEFEVNREKSCIVLNMNIKGEESEEEVFEENVLDRTALISSRRSVLGVNAKSL